MNKGRRTRKTVEEMFFEFYFSLCNTFPFGREMPNNPRQLKKNGVIDQGEKSEQIKRKQNTDQGKKSLDEKKKKGSRRKSIDKKKRKTDKGKNNRRKGKKQTKE